MKIERIAHFCVMTDDLAATREFYELLGARLVFEFVREGAVIGFYLGIGERDFVEAFLIGEKPGAERGQALDHVCFETADLDGLRAKLGAAGREPGAVKTGCDRSRQFWVTAPEGTRVEFHEYTPESAQFSGGSVEVDW